jgi:AcrR family transcriptional regulator
MSDTAKRGSPGRKSPPMPKTERGEKTRRRLLDAAIKEFGTRGYHAASVVSITRRARVAQGTFYIYFRSKERLYRAVIEELGAFTRQWIGERLDPALDAVASEVQRIALLVDFVRGHRSLYTIIMQAQLVAPDVHRGYFEAFAAAYKQRIETQVNAGVFRHGNIEERAWGMVGLSAFIGMRYGLWDDDRPSREIAKDLSDFLAGALATRR